MICEHKQGIFYLKQHFLPSLKCSKIMQSMNSRDTDSYGNDSDSNFGKKSDMILEDESSLRDV